MSLLFGAQALSFTTRDSDTESSSGCTLAAVASCVEAGRFFCWPRHCCISKRTVRFKQTFRGWEYDGCTSTAAAGNEGWA